ncbi:molybdenum cofactor guanylyltransferase MobA [Uliginosibacterium sp. 31-16]|uniref:molybdenum cofactor guanylyltransferase MobA n=1 Tax=Uliginosibacterium sp. 31-16 TaxID=3068315 RepID=UPI00273FE431|nr:molybdenum cofactor guanylyltransferase MobA [Uliginosibacterium sp. 31-16]MDP5238073.1 molybdenum cofactor guanylyltransferase MobA [Uliginosibacterium sp. 31-16]
MKLTGAILAGGASRRMGGQDKGLVEFRGRPLVAWVIDALAPQVDEVLIVANRNLEVYRAFGHRVVSDIRPDFPGPLAGFEAALAHAQHDWILTCPTDAPLLPPDYACLLSRAAPASPAVVLVDGHWEPLFSLLPKTALPNLSTALDAGERKAQRWLASLDPVRVSMDSHAAQLRDADSPEDLARLDGAS